MSNSVLLCYGAFLLAYYYFVLRRYNTLGFRLFSLFFFTAVATTYWCYTAERDLRSIQKNGVATNATVISKTSEHVRFRFAEQSGKVVERTQQGGVSVQELAEIQEGEGAPILYLPGSKKVFLATSYQRQLQDNIYFLVFPAVLFLLGSGCWFFLRKYRVHAHEGTIYEYVTNESGKIVLDDAASPWSRAFRNYATFGKLFDLFRR